MKRAMRLTITLTVQEGSPGHPTRFSSVFGKISKMLSDGARSGSFDQPYEYTQGGESNREIATIDFDVAPVNATPGA